MRFDIYHILTFTKTWYFQDSKDFSHVYVGTSTEGEIFGVKTFLPINIIFVLMSITTLLNLYPTIPEKIQQQF